MQLHNTHKIVHHLSWRTRIKSKRLKQFTGNINALENALGSLSGVTSVRIATLSGSVVIEHHGQSLNRASVFELLDHYLKIPGTNKKNRPLTHVSGKYLLISGVPLLARWVGIITLTGPLSLLFTAFFGISLSIPVIREEIRSIRTTGKPGLTSLTTSALYYAMFTGAPGNALSIFWLFNLSSWLEDKTLSHTRNSIREMLCSKNHNAWLIKDGLEVKIPASTLVPGDLIRLRQGDYVPVDGIVQNGKALINEAVMTGESMPVLKKTGDRVLAGTIIESGDIVLDIVSSESETKLASIIRIVENAENTETGYRRYADEFGKRLFPFSLALFSGTLLLTGNLYKAISMLIITCPCAIRLSSSTAVTAAMGNAAKKGILVKDGNSIEQAGRINTLAFDKTGTLTRGNPGVTRIVSLEPDLEPDQLLCLAAAAQKPFRHPVTEAVLEKADSKKLTIPEAHDHHHSVGKGVSAITNGLNPETDKRVNIKVGSASYMKECLIDCKNAVFIVNHMKTLREIILYVGVNGKLSGLIGLSDQLKDNAPSVLNSIKTRDIGHIAMLTGDLEQVAQKAADNIRVDEVLCELSPENKAKWIISRKKRFPEELIAIVGDGINDTPAFAHADLSIAMGLNGADTAVEYADIVIQTDDLDLVDELFFLGKKTRRIFRQNVSLTVLLNSLIGLSTAIGYVSPFTGALIHNLVTLGVVGNAGRLLIAEKEPLPPDIADNRTDSIIHEPGVIRSIRAEEITNYPTGTQI